MPLPFNATIRSNPMKTKLVLGAVAAAIAVFSQGAFAQSASSPSRADVKAEAKKNKTPAGEATGSVTPHQDLGHDQGGAQGPDQGRPESRQDSGSRRIRPTHAAARSPDHRPHRAQGRNQGSRQDGQDHSGRRGPRRAEEVKAARALLAAHRQQKATPRSRLFFWASPGQVFDPRAWRTSRTATSDVPPCRAETARSP